MLFSQCQLTWWSTPPHSDPFGTIEAVKMMKLASCLSKIFEIWRQYYEVGLSFRKMRKKMIARVENLFFWAKQRILGKQVARIFLEIYMYGNGVCIGVGPQARGPPKYHAKSHISLHCIMLTQQEVFSQI